jgi:hypothetical protein
LKNVASGKKGVISKAAEKKLLEEDVVGRPVCPLPHTYAKIKTKNCVFCCMHVRRKRVRKRMVSLIGLIPRGLRVSPYLPKQLSRGRRGRTRQSTRLHLVIWPS